MSGLAIRTARREDLPAVLSLYAELGGGRVATLAEATVLFDRLALYPDYTLHLAWRDGQPVGTFALLVMDNIAHWGTPSAVVEAVVVAASARGGGVGRAMMAEACRLAAARGCYKLALSSNDANAAAHAFYETLGFRRHGVSFALELQTDRTGRAA